MTDILNYATIGLMLFLGCVSIVASAGAVRRCAHVWRPIRSRCIVCNYDLTELPPSQCPECGIDVSSQNLRRVSRRLLARGGCLFVIAIACGISFGYVLHARIAGVPTVLPDWVLVRTFDKLDQAGWIEVERRGIREMSSSQISRVLHVVRELSTQPGDQRHQIAAHVLMGALDREQVMIVVDAVLRSNANSMQGVLLSAIAEHRQTLGEQDARELLLRVLNGDGSDSFKCTAAYLLAPIEHRQVDRRTIEQLLVAYRATANDDCCRPAVVRAVSIAGRAARRYRLIDDADFNSSVHDLAKHIATDALTHQDDEARMRDAVLALQYLDVDLEVVDRLLRIARE